MLWKSPNPAFSALLDALAAHHAVVHVVGGVVRDLLRGRAAGTTDLDLVVEYRQPLALARRVADQLGWAFYPLDEGRDVARLVFQPGSGDTLVCDLAGLRGPTLEADLYLRDFTINAMAIADVTTNPTLLDPSNGQEDLTRRLVRRVSSVSLADDPVRLLRAVRFATQLDFTVETDTAGQIRRLSGYLTQVSAERLRDELWKTLTTTAPSAGVRLLESFGLLSVVLPEVDALRGVRQTAPHIHDVYEHTLAAVDYAATCVAWIDGRSKLMDAELVEHLAPWRYALRQHLATPLAAGRRRGEWLVWHALLHDIGKPLTRTEERQESGLLRTRFFDHEEIGADLTVNRLSHLRFSRAEIDLAAAVVRGHMRPHHLHSAFAGTSISRRATFRFFRDTAGKQSGVRPGVDVLLLALADVHAIYGAPPPDWRDFLQHISALLTYAFAAPDTATVPLVNGRDLMQRFNLAPGARLGQLLEYLLEAQAAGDIDSREDAFNLASDWLIEAKQATG